MGLGSVSSSVIAAKRPFPRPRVPLPARLPQLLPELLLLFVVDSIYKYGRKVANGQTDDAFRHADNVWSFERAVHLPSEHTVQQLMLHSHTVIHTANYLYATVHFPAMAIFLGWMFVKKRAHYLWIRRAIVIQTMLALLGHLFFPLAPPRMLHGDGMIDTASVYGPAVYGKPDGDSMSNQFAAMPSLHVGWALAIAIGLIAAYRSRWRWLWLLHPLVTTLIVVGTANHYWLDGIVGSALLAVALAVIPGPVTDPPAPLPGRDHWAWPLRRTPVPAAEPGLATIPEPATGSPAVQRTERSRN
ncbi:phosphatase PAP2 family protein [Streptomyces sp. NBC_01198]|uniref:phosphatase PAP2 family protein n=1 Tax=Streptomyces sp. NBC_01198 TaxID=2903769 RepID=UPI002E162E13|nr:phosphatase PAP2 family protein [Streptomyces sp. NBC_01198]